MKRFATEVFTPFAVNMGPSFKLMMWDTGERDEYGKHTFKYELRAFWASKNVDEILFEGSDFHAHYSPEHPQGLHDKASVIAGLMSFLTLRPGDTDSEYFEKYTAKQLEYCEQHAEALSLEVIDRYGEH